MIHGDNYPPSAMRVFTAQALSILKMIFIACIVLGQNPFFWLNINTPSAYSWALENKIYACMMLFFLSGMVEGHLLSTGAFEVTFNDVPVWSKLETGRVPAPQEMFEIVESHMRLYQSSYTNSFKNL